MTENDGFNSPTQQDLEMIAKSRDSLLRHRLEQQNKAAAKKLNLKPGDKLCPICGEKLRLKTKEPLQYCAVCQGRLDAGETALVCIDLRWAFVAPDKLLESMLVGTGKVKVDDLEITADQIAALRGKVIGVLPELIDVLSVKSDADSDPKSEQN